MTTSQSPIREALKRVAVALKAADVPFALAGSYASWARGGPEPNHDVDFLVAADDVERALRACSESGLRIERPPEDWLVKVWHESGGEQVLVDLIYRPAGAEVGREALGRADELEVDSVNMPVVSATDFICMRLHALSEHSCDFSQLLPHVRALREQVDWNAVRTEGGGNPYAESFLFLCETLGVVNG